MKEIKGDSLTIWKTFKSKRLYIKRKLNLKKKMDGWKHMFSYFFHQNNTRLFVESPN